MLIKDVLEFSSDKRCTHECAILFGIMAVDNGMSAPERWINSLPWLDETVGQFWDALEGTEDLDDEIVVDLMLDAICEVPRHLAGAVAAYVYALMRADGLNSSANRFRAVAIERTDFGAVRQ